MAKVDVADVVRHGDKLILPEKMTPADGIDVLQRVMAAEEQFIAYRREFKCFPAEGAYALQKAMEKVCGFTSMGSKKEGGFMGMGFEPPPGSITLQISPSKQVKVPWGKFIIPGGQKDYIRPEMARGDDGSATFVVMGELRRKFEPLVDKICAEIARMLKEESIYKGQAFRVGFQDINGDRLTIPSVEFLDVERNGKIIAFNKETEEIIEDEIFAVLQNVEKCRELGTLKRGIIAAGEPGTGKTLLAYHIAREAVRNGVTFVYGKADEVVEGMQLAKMYQPAVFLVEDIDRVTSGMRTTGLDNILNTLDGVDSKNNEVIVVLTTNDVASINVAMLRSGRLDTKLFIEAPNAETCQRLLTSFSGLKETQTKEASELLAGCIPADIHECVKRAQLRALMRNEKMGGEHLTRSARRLAHERQIMLKLRKATENDDAILLQGDGVQLVARKEREIQ